MHLAYDSDVTVDQLQGGDLRVARKRRRTTEGAHDVHGVRSDPVAAGFVSPDRGAVEHQHPSIRALSQRCQCGAAASRTGADDHQVPDDDTPSRHERPRSLPMAWCHGRIRLDPGRPHVRVTAAGP